MRRFHLLELHEQEWFPQTWRELFQLSLGRGMSLFGVFDNLVDPFRRFLERQKPNSILDLCTGSGELGVLMWRRGTASFTDETRPKLVLSDLYPNFEAYMSHKLAYPGQVDYFPEPVDALNPPEHVPRTWMLFDSLHHFRPDQARMILKEATKKTDGIASFESTDRSWRNLLQVVLFAPWATAIVTAFMLRPIRFRNILWGLIIPVVPLTTMIDGIVSNLRTHTQEELREMIRLIDEPGFQWELGSAIAPRSGGLRVNYFFGWRCHHGTSTSAREE